MDKNRQDERVSEQSSDDEENKRESETSSIEFKEKVKAKLAKLNKKEEIDESNFEDEINHLKEKNASLEKKVEQLEQTNEQLLQENEQLRNEVDKVNEPNLNILESLIAPVNTLDQIASAYRNQGDHDLIAEQLEKVAELTVQQIETAGIEEIPVYGKEIDGKYMESFGQAMNVKDDSLEPHTVAIVSRRAFKKKDSDEIIQHALVYTVPEEE